MLRTLSIRNYALIEDLEVEFEGGLNIITGQTGAGKSILVGAMEMIIGERASTDVIRSGADKAVIEGVFRNVDIPDVRELLAENAIEEYPDGELIMRREIRSSKSRGFINDTPATIQLMRQVANHLVDLHGQHEHQSLLRTETHLDLLDDFGNLEGLRSEYREQYQQLQELYEKRAGLMARERELEERKELYEFQMQEIDEVNPQPGEEEQLLAEQRVLSNAEHLYEVSAELYRSLYETEDSAYEQLVEAVQEFRELEEIDDEFEEPREELESAEIIISEVTSFLQDYHESVEFDPERLDQIRDRLGALDHLKRKYGGSIEAVLEHREEIGETYELAANYEETIAELSEEIDELRDELSETALKLSERRKEIARVVEDKVVEELVQLGIKHAEFEVRFSRKADPDGWIALPVDGDGQECFEAFSTGMDRVEYYISTNVGEAPRPLRDVASGGEISRIMLALKSILAKSERLPVLVFDEIDVGISGRIARKVGRTMYDLAQHHQLIAITHLPQIASLADVHCAVEKRVEDGRTKTIIRRLSEKDRAREVAGMISGSDVTDAAIESARELMDPTHEES